MYFITSDEEIIPFRFDYGQELFVVDFRDADEDMLEDIVECKFEDEIHQVLEVVIVETTRRVFMLDVVLDSDDESESSEDEFSDDSDDDYGDSDDDDSEEVDEDDGEHHRALLARMGHLEV